MNQKLFWLIEEAFCSLRKEEIGGKRIEGVGGVGGRKLK